MELEKSCMESAEISAPESTKKRREVSFHCGKSKGRSRMSQKIRESFLRDFMPADVRSTGKWIAPAIFDSAEVDGMGFRRIRNRDPGCPSVWDLGPSVQSESIESEVRRALFVEIPGGSKED